MSNRSSMKGTWPFCAEDYLSPLAVPTGKNPDDVLISYGARMRFS